MGGQRSDRHPHVIVIDKDNYDLNTKQNFYGFCSSEKEIKMNKIKFNKTNLDSIIASETRQRFYAEECKGLHLDVLTTGKKVFRLNYKLNYQSKYFTIGEYPFVTPYLAIKTAKDLFQQIHLGHDPQLSKTRNRQEPTFKEYFLNEYLQIKLNKSGYAGITLFVDNSLKITFPDLKDKKLNGHVESWNAYLRKSKFLNNKMSEIKHTDIQILFNTISLNSKSFANRIIRELRAIFNTNLQLTRNPVSDALKVSIKLHQCKPRKIKLNNQELNNLIESAYRLKGGKYFLQIRAILIMLFEGMRPSEVLKMKWSDISKEGVYTVSSKTGIIEIPLSNTTLEILNTIPSNHHYVFYCSRTNSYLKNVRRTWISMLCLAGIIDKKFKLYDLRKTFSSRATKEFDLFQSSKLTNHSSINVVEKHYSHLDIDEIKQAKNILANQLNNKTLFLCKENKNDTIKNNERDNETNKSRPILRIPNN